VSVINKMLRDLDDRRSPGLGDSSAPSSAGLRQGTVSIASRTQVAPTLRTHQPFRALWWGALLFAVLALAGAGGLWQAGYLDTPRVQVAVAPMPPAPVVVPAPALAPAASAPAAPVVAEPSAAPVAGDAQEVAEPVPVPAPRAASASVVLRMDSTLSLRKLLETELAPISVKAKTPPAERPAPKAAPVTSSAQVPVAVPIQLPDATQVALRQQQAGKDAIAQAQGMWNAGSREAAIDLMQQVVASAERATTGGATPANTQLLVLVVRELTRMQLLESRPGPVLELLTRLEPVLGNQPDLWAVRANAAQRLGRHQDSVHAYMMALQTRPGEQRWLLGAAVSLAALGQTASAADMAEKARAAGSVSKDVLAYLRQMGVPVKDQ
jgi:hypothetical protein